MKSVTAQIMAEIDKRAQEEYGIPSAVLMENAGSKVAELIISDNGENKTKPVIILCGKGNNGGDGFVVARLLKNAGFTNIKIYGFSEAEMKPGAAKNNFIKINNLQFKVRPLFDFLAREEALEDCVIVDAIFGTGFKGELNDHFQSIGNKINASGAIVYAVDIPSGLNSTSGEASEDCVKANKTITFGIAKKGFYAGDGPSVCGEVIVADIGFPKELIEEYM